MSKVHGRAEIRQNGSFIETFDDASLSPGGVKNNTRMSATNFNYNQTLIPGKVVCKHPVKADTSLVALQQLAGVDITFTSDIGKVFIIRNAAQTGELEMSGGNDGGTVELTFEGDPAEEMSV